MLETVHMWAAKSLVAPLGAVPRGRQVPPAGPVGRWSVSWTASHPFEHLLASIQTIGCPPPLARPPLARCLLSLPRWGLGRGRAATASTVSVGPPPWRRCWDRHTSYVANVTGAVEPASTAHALGDMAGPASGGGEHNFNVRLGAPGGTEKREEGEHRRNFLRSDRTSGIRTN